MPESLSNAITITRSDGLLIVRRKGGASEPNRPTPDQLDESPNAEGLVDYYKELPNDDPKAIEWRRKLGTMMIEELSMRDDLARNLKQKLDGGAGGSNYHLSALPEGYVLWQHTKYFKEGFGDRKKPSHAGGGNDRQDAYLYGHPAGRKKRFRSPREFLPHLMWLSMDNDKDQVGCVCKLCAPNRSGIVAKSTDVAAKILPSSTATTAIPPAQTIESRNGTPIGSTTSTPTPGVQPIQYAPILPPGMTRKSGPTAPSRETITGANGLFDLRQENNDLLNGMQQ